MKENYVVQLKEIEMTLKISKPLNIHQKIVTPEYCLPSNHAAFVPNIFSFDA